MKKSLAPASEMKIITQQQTKVTFAILSLMAALFACSTAQSIKHQSKIHPYGFNTGHNYIITNPDQNKIKPKHYHPKKKP